MSEGLVLFLIFTFIVAFIILVTSKLGLHPFLALLISAIIGGIFAGMPITRTLQVIAEGFGSTLKNIGIVIALGSIIGYILEKSGGAVKMAEGVLNIVGEKRSVLAMSITGFLVSIPVFCDSAFIILSSLNRALSRKSKISLSVFATALSMGLYSSHVFIPPTPGPLAVASNLNVDIGLVILMGILVALPSVLAGYFWAIKYAKKFNITVTEDKGVIPEENEELPGRFMSFMPIIFPVVLIAFKSVADFPSHPFGSGILLTFFDFVGHPITALLIGVLFSFLLVKRLSKKVINDWVGEGLKSAGVIILITGAGGSLGEVLKEIRVGTVFGDFLSQFNLGIFLPFIISAALKTAQGSSTVAMITTSALIAPLLGGLGFDSPLGRLLVVNSICAGSMVVSHINDSYFWVVSQFSDMDVSTAYKCQTMGSLITGIVGIIWIAVISFIIL